MNWKKSTLVRSEILRHFVNILTLDDKYKHRNMLNFTQQLEAQLYPEQKTFSGFFYAFLKCALNLDFLKKKDEYPSLIISKIINSEIGGYLKV